jgi:hypothetical protein
MERIRLPRGEWFYDPNKQLGQKGGFGSVYEGQSAAHGDLAIKKLHLSADKAAHREIGIAGALAARPLANVIPVFDAGEDSDSRAYFLVMPRAEYSLQDVLNQGRTFAGEASGLLLQIVSGLLEVSDIVHRDLKPANILYHEGKWKIADFGIARFVEEATSLQTLKACLTKHYAAPEQWEYIRATAATDVYALGCIGYALLTGSPPFQGTSDELRDRHLHADPPPLDLSVPPQLRSLLAMMLRKPPEARPNLNRVKTILSDIIKRTGEPSPTSFDQLAEVGANVARARAEAERVEKQVFTQTEARLRLATAGGKTLREIMGRLFNRLQTNVPIANRGAYSLTLGQGIMQVSVAPEVSMIDPGFLNAEAFTFSKWDVVLVETIAVRQQHPVYEWSASLWYCKLPETTDYRWYEASYFSFHRAEAYAPYDLSTKIRDADLAASLIMHIYQLAFGPQPIDDEDEDDFGERWAALLALSAEGKLGHPRSLPLQPKFWRGPFVV